MNASGISIGFWMGFGQSDNVKAPKPKKQQGHQYPGATTLPAIDYSYGSIPNNPLCYSYPGSYSSAGSSFPSRVPSPKKSPPPVVESAERIPTPVPEELASPKN
jgi:hypothetical protein